MKATEDIMVSRERSFIRRCALFLISSLLDGKKTTKPSVKLNFYKGEDPLSMISKQ